MTEVTQILARIATGDETARDQLLPVVYDELRRLAYARMTSERHDHTLQPTALVHEAYLRLVSSDGDQWSGRGHFFAAAAEAMRRILIEWTRARQRQKRGGDLQRRPLGDHATVAPDDPELVLSVDEAIQQLAAEDPRLATLVKLRYFCGLTLTEAASVLNVARSTAIQDWAYARARLRVLLREAVSVPLTPGPDDVALPQ